MDLFNTIAGICSIASLLISFLTLSYVYKISVNISNDNSVKTGNQLAIGSKNKQAGRDFNEK